jgi:hypothetical protein
VKHTLTITALVLFASTWASGAAMSQTRSRTHMTRQAAVTDCVAQGKAAVGPATDMSGGIRAAGYNVYSSCMHSHGFRP